MICPNSNFNYTVIQVGREGKTPAREIVEGPLLSWFPSFVVVVYRFSKGFFSSILINHSWFAFIFTSSNPTPHIEQQVLSGNYPIGLMLNYTLCTVQQPACTCGSGQFWHWVWISVSISQSISKGSNSAQTFDNIYFTNLLVSSGNALPIGVENMCHRNRPGVFTRVSWFEAWIKKVTQGIVSFL